MMLDYRYFGKSFMHTKNKTGSRILPWETPKVTGIVSVLLSRCDLIERLVNQFKRLFLMPLHCNLHSSLMCVKDLDSVHNNEICLTVVIVKCRLLY